MIILKAYIQLFNGRPRTEWEIEIDEEELEDMSEAERNEYFELLVEESLEHHVAYGWEEESR